MRSTLATLALGLGLTMAGSGLALADETKPFGALECVPQEGIRFCEGSIDTRVRSFDGVPLDVNVVLPESVSRDLPLVVISHGFGGEKTPFAGMKRWAVEGYAAMAISARGFGHSCGSPESRQADLQGCATGWLHLDDNRYEVRDVQTLAGLLADQGIIDGERIGLVGGSYGGGLSMAGAVLKNRIMEPDGTLKPWRSPAGKPMRIAGATPGNAWSDLNYGLAPNGRSLDYVVTDPDDNLAPYGIAKTGMITQLGIGGGTKGGYYGPEAASFVAFWGTNGDQPPNPAYDGFVSEIARYHSSYYLLDSGEPPAPMLLTNGFTDDLFPVDEAVRLYNKVRASWPQTPISLRAFDTGHFRAQGKEADTALAGRAQRAWIDYHVKGEGAPPFEGVTALTQTCPKEAPSGGPYTAPNWAALHPGEVRTEFAAPQTVTSAGGDPEIAAGFAPIALRGAKACDETADVDETGTATYRVPFSEEATLLGSPTVIADIEVSGAYPQVITRLLDVDKATGMQTLVARGIYRPDPSGRQVFQLHPAGWTFKPGHEAKLQVLGNEPTYAHSPTAPFSIRVGNLELRLPTLDPPNGRNVLAPAPPVLPPGAQLAPDVKVDDGSGGPQGADQPTGPSGNGPQPSDTNGVSSDGRGSSGAGGRPPAGKPRCFAAASSAGARRIGRAGLGNRRSDVRRAFGARGRYRRFVDRYCLSDNSTIRIGYPSPKALRSLAQGERRRLRGRVSLVLTTSRRSTVRGINVGAGVRELLRRTGRRRGVRVGENVWFVRRGSRAGHVFKVRGGVVREVGLADRRQTATNRRVKRFFTSNR